MKEDKLKILTRLLKKDHITEEEFMSLLETEKEIQYINTYNIPYQSPIDRNPFIVTYSP